MSTQEFLTYCDGRYTTLLDYYDKRAVAAKRGYNICSIYILFVSIAISPIQGLGLNGSGSTIAKVLVMVLSPTVALAAGLAAHFRFHEHWITYRATWDALSRERSMHDAQAGPYRHAVEHNALFVERVEEIVAKEGKEFYSRQASQSRGAQTDEPTIPPVPRH